MRKFTYGLVWRTRGRGTGDITPVDIKPDEAGIQADGDAQGNPYGTSDEPYEDILGGSADNDHILAGELNDDVGAGAGDDWIEGGSGNDYLHGETGKDLIEGGSGSDILIGEEGDDRLYANSKIGTASAIEDGNNDMGSGEKGDWLAGNDGDDLLIGGADNDVLSGGLGADLLIGGAGNDNLLGDSDYTAQYQWEDSPRYSIGSTDWYHSRADTYDWTVTPGPEHTVFAPVTGETNPAGGGADVIYAGAGNGGSDTLLVRQAMTRWSATTMTTLLTGKVTITSMARMATTCSMPAVERTRCMAVR